MHHRRSTMKRWRHAVLAGVVTLITVAGSGGETAHAASRNPAVFQGYKHPRPPYPGGGGTDTAALNLGPYPEDLAKVPLVMAGTVLAGRCREVVETPDYWTSTLEARLRIDIAEETVAVRVTKVLRNHYPDIGRAPFVVTVLQHDTDYFGGDPYSSALRPGDPVVIFLSRSGPPIKAPTFFDPREPTYVVAWGASGVFDWDRHNRVAQQFVSLDHPYLSMTELLNLTRPKKGTKLPPLAAWTAPKVTPLSTCLPWGTGPRPA